MGMVVRLHPPGASCGSKPYRVLRGLRAPAGVPELALPSIARRVSCRGRVTTSASASGGGGGRGGGGRGHEGGGWALPGAPPALWLARRADVALAEELSEGLAEFGGAEAWGRGALPVVYSPRYNIRFFGLEKLHPFDSCKYEKVVAGLEAAGVVGGELPAPLEVGREQLLDVHLPEYLDSLASPSKVAEVAELPPLALLPRALVERQVLGPMRCMTGGTTLAAGLALTHGCAFNLGGGMHHAHAAAGGGWCVYDDIYVAIRAVRRATQRVRRVLVVDLDAHQGNGVARDVARFQDEDTFLVDLYHEGIYPLDREAEEAVHARAPLRKGTGDEEYLARLEEALAEAARRFPSPDLVVYNAGTDVLEGDPLGGLGLSPGGVVRRDERVFRFAAEEAGGGAPVVMVLSGGYTPASADVIVESITNLHCKLGLEELWGS